MPGSAGLCGQPGQLVALASTATSFAIRSLKARNSSTPGISGTIHISLVAAMPPLAFVPSFAFASMVMVRRASFAVRPSMLRLFHWSDMRIEYICPSLALLVLVESLF